MEDGDDFLGRKHTSNLPLLVIYAPIFDCSCFDWPIFEQIVIVIYGPIFNQAPDSLNRWTNSV